MFYGRLFVRLPPSPVLCKGGLTKFLEPGSAVRNRIESFKAVFLKSTKRTQTGRAAQKIAEAIVVTQAA